MDRLRKYTVDFLFRTTVCLCLLLLCYIVNRLWPGAFGAFRDKLFYDVDLGLLVKEFRELGRCVLPG